MNLKVRVKNPVFWVQIVLSILTPILAYAGLTAQDLTTWGKLKYRVLKMRNVVGIVVRVSLAVKSTVLSVGLNIGDL